MDTLTLPRNLEKLEVKNNQLNKGSLNYLNDKKSEILNIIKTPITSQHIDNINKFSKQLFNAFDEATRKIYHENYNKLPDINKIFIKNGYHKALVSNVTEYGIYVVMFKGGPKSFISEKKLLSNKDYLRGDEIIVDLQKDGDNTNIKEVDKRYYELQKKGLLNKIVNYLPKSGGKSISGKVVGLGEDNKGEEVIFEQENGNKFALKIETLLKGIQKPEKIKEKKIEIKKPEIQQKVVIEKKNNSHVVTKKPSVSKIVYDGSQEVSGRDGEKIIYNNQK